MFDTYTYFSIGLVQILVHIFFLNKDVQYQSLGMHVVILY